MWGCQKVQTAKNSNFKNVLLTALQQLSEITTTSLIFRVRNVGSGVGTDKRQNGISTIRSLTGVSDPEALSLIRNYWISSTNPEPGVQIPISHVLNE